MPLTKEERAAISRANGARSKGPVTEDGKRVSRANSLRHGKSARKLLEEFVDANTSIHDDRSRYRRALTAAIRQLAPANYVELSLAAAVAGDDFRINRWNAVESTLLDLEYRKWSKILRRQDPNADHEEIFAEAAASLSRRSEIPKFLDSERRRLIRSRESALRLIERLQRAHPSKPAKAVQMATKSRPESLKLKAA